MSGFPKPPEDDLLAVIGNVRIRTTELDEVIGSHLSDKNVFFTDGGSAAPTCTRRAWYFKSDGKQRVNGKFHIQNVNSNYSLLKKCSIYGIS